MQEVKGKEKSGRKGAKSETARKEMQIRKKRKEKKAMHLCKESHVTAQGEGCKVKSTRRRLEAGELKEGNSRRVVQVQGGKRREEGNEEECKCSRSARRKIYKEESARWRVVLGKCKDGGARRECREESARGGA